jgi:hypothetical protein
MLYVSDSDPSTSALALRVCMHGHCRSIAMRAWESESESDDAVACMLITRSSTVQRAIWRQIIEQLAA